MMKEATAILQKYWGYTSFRSPQEEIISSVLAGQDTIALLPTGAGKSICYQVPALLVKGKTLVISPLIALMQDQVDQLFMRGIRARALHSHLSVREMDALLDNFVFGDLPILYVSPERLASEIFKLRLSKVKVSLIAVDESHCISQWGYDFRPAYLNIAAIREIHPETPVLALTATATPRVLEDIAASLCMKKPAIFRKSFARTNIALYASIQEDKDTEISLLLSHVKGSSLIYVRNRKETIRISTWLQSKGISSLPYHGGMEKSLREKNQQAWMAGKVQVVVCTNAFGMGIDKSDVRLVIHVDVPASLEEYYQEAGRAGRDGNPALAVALISFSDLQKARNAVEDQYPSIEQITYVYEKLCRYYKVAYGSGEMETYVLALHDIAEFASILVKKLYPILRILEREGWISVSEGMKNPSLIQVHANREDMLQLESAAPEKALVLTQLLRSYDGVQTIPVHMDERRLAQNLSMQEQALTGKLHEMKSEGLIFYQPRTNQPAITFLRPRPREGEFSIDKTSYLKRKKLAMGRLEAMTDYLELEQSCRQLRILSYFGEKGHACGQCDVCQSSQLPDPGTAAAGRIWQHLHTSIKEKNVYLKSYLALYPLFHRRKLRNLISHWASEGFIHIDLNGKMTLLKDVHE